MFNMQERMNLVKTIKDVFNKSGHRLPHFTDVNVPSVNHKENFGTVTLTGTNVIIAVTTTDNTVTLTNVDKRKVDAVKIQEPLRIEIIKAMLDFKDCIRY